MSETCTQAHCLGVHMFVYVCFYWHIIIIEADKEAIAKVNLLLGAKIYFIVTVFIIYA